MYSTLVLGAGPGGTGPLVWAAQQGKLDGWLADGVALLDRSASIGGTLGRYVVNSDSLGAAYLECLDAPQGAAILAPLRADPAALEMQAMRHGLPPLSLVDRYLHRLGTVLEEAIARHPRSRYLPRVEIRALHLRAASVIAEIVGVDGRAQLIEGRSAILALGGRQHPASYLDVELAAGVRLAELDPAKLMPSGELLSRSGLARALARLQLAKDPRVVILGGSHSAFSAAWVLTNLLPEVAFSAQSIRIVQRRPPRAFYESREAALADGYAVSERDVCPRTQRVNRLGGLRGDGRGLWRQLTLRPGTDPEPRVEVLSQAAAEASPLQLRRLLHEATLIVPAFGYCATTVPMYDEEGHRLRLNAELGRTAVGDDARVLLADGSLLPHVFAIGLGTGFRPPREMGGEPSFDGQANSLWLYQNDIGALVYQGVHEIRDQFAPRRRRRSLRAQARAMAAQIDGVVPLPRLSTMGD